MRNLTIEDRLALLNGSGAWHTDSCGGKLPQLTMSDGPHGLRKQAEGLSADINHSELATCFPTASCIACSWDREALAKMGAAISAEAKALGVDLLLGPGVNMKRSPLCGRNFEYYSEDPYLAGECAASFIGALEKNGIGACVKHFACNNRENRRMTSNSVVDERALHEIYLSAFERVVKKAKPAAVMSSYNRVNGVYSSANRKLLTETLREKWGFNGAVISDWSGTMDVVKSAKAGLNLEMPHSYGAHLQELRDAVASGELTQEELERANAPVLAMLDRFCAGEKQKPAPADMAEQHRIAKELALNSAVLLKNGGLLPLPAGKKLLAVGDLARKVRFQGGGSSHIFTAPAPDAVDSLKALGYDVEYSQGYREDSLKSDSRLENAAAEAAESCDILLLFCGMTELIESESYDRSDMELPENQRSLIEALAKHRGKTVFVCFGGSPFRMPFYESASDILMMYLAGEASAEACAELLAGKANPCGKLAETWPLSVEDTPCAGLFDTESPNILYSESIFTGYRYYETFGVPVRFPFGYGLSYTRFAHSGLELKRQGDASVTVSWTVKNTGSRAGAEISQVYVRNPDAGAGRPAVELRGFEKCFLEPGEEKRLSATLDARAFSVYDVSKAEFLPVPGAYTVAVGSSVRDLALRGEFTVIADYRPAIPAVETPDTNAAVHFSGEGLKKLFGGEMPLIPEPERGNITIFDSVETVCKYSVRGKILRRILLMILPMTVKGGKKNPTYRMVKSGVMETPAYGISALSNNSLKQGLMKSLVKAANK